MQKLGFNKRIRVICIPKDTFLGVFWRKNGVNIFGPIPDSHPWSPVKSDPYLLRACLSVADLPAPTSRGSAWWPAWWCGWPGGRGTGCTGTWCWTRGRPGPGDGSPDSAQPSWWITLTAVQVHQSQQLGSQTRERKSNEYFWMIFIPLSTLYA